MRALIASDLHGSYPALKFIVDKAKETKPDMLILLGDLVYHGPRNPLPEGYDTLAMLGGVDQLTGLPCPLIAVQGNCDAEVDVCQMPFRITENAWIEADGLKIFACHGHHLPENAPIENMAAGTVILRGHTHCPRGETQGGLHFWNPGSLSLPKQGFPKSYGLYENGKFTVFAKDGAEILSHRPQ